MADTKVSALTPATTVNAADYLMLVQGGSSVKVSVETLIQKLPTRTIVLEASEAVASGAIATNILITKVTATNAGAAYTLAAGTHGMEKVIICQAADATTPSAVITVTGGSTGLSTITFNAIGDSVHLKNIDNLWYVAGSNSIESEASEVVASGAITTNKSMTKVTATDPAAAYTLATGKHGTEKYIICQAVSGASPSAVITVTGGATGLSTITFNAIGDSVYLKNIDNLWYVAGQNSVVIA